MKKFFKEIKAPLIASIFTAILILIIFKIGFTFNFFTNPAPKIQRTLESSGIGQVTAVPDTAKINFGVTNTSNTVVNAQNQTNQTIAKILNDFKSLKIDPKNITTSNYTIYPQYIYGSNSQVPSGYSVTQNITLKISPIEKAGQAIDIATRDGANMLGAITFTFSNQKQTSLEQQARAIAINDAKKKAIDEAKITGIKLLRIINVTDVTTNPIIYPRPIMIYQKTVTTNPTQLPPGETTVEKSVKVTFEIE